MIVLKHDPRHMYPRIDYIITRERRLQAMLDEAGVSARELLDKHNKAVSLSHELDRRSFY